MAMQFKKAQRRLSKLRLAIQGPSGSGKTYGALLLAKGLGGSIAVIDTEHGSASLYADIEGMPEFDVLDLEAPYTPERYIEAITAAEKAGYDTLIIDSMSHEWNGQGGCCELNEALASSKYRGNTWSAWSETTPRHRKFVDKMLASKCHIIATLRSKSDYLVSDENGRKKIQKIGLKAEQRDGMDYEFTIVFDVAVDTHNCTTSKDRTSLFADPFRMSEMTGQKIRKWLNSAAAEEVLTSEPSKKEEQPISGVATESNKPAKNIEELEEDLWDAPKPQKSGLSQFQAVRADELLDALNSADGMKQVKSIAKTIKELNLPSDSKEHKELVKAYCSAKKRILG